MAWFLPSRPRDGTRAPPSTSLAFGARCRERGIPLSMGSAVDEGEPHPTGTHPQILLTRPSLVLLWTNLEVLSPFNLVYPSQCMPNVFPKALRIHLVNEPSEVPKRGHWIVLPPVVY